MHVVVKKTHSARLASMCLPLLLRCLFAFLSPNSCMWFVYLTLTPTPPPHPVLSGVVVSPPPYSPAIKALTNDRHTYTQCHIHFTYYFFCVQEAPDAKQHMCVLVFPKVVFVPLNFKFFVPLYSVTEYKLMYLCAVRLLVTLFIQTLSLFSFCVLTQLIQSL